MSVELWPAPTTTDVDADIMAERQRRLRLYLAAEDSADLRAALYRHCQVDPRFWLANFAWTRAPRATRIHGTNRIPFLLWDYAVRAIDLFLGRGQDSPPDGEILRNVAVRKSREMGGTIVPALLVIWDWQFNRGADYGFVSRVERNVDNGKSTGGGSIFSYIRWAIRQQPRWLRPTPWVAKKRDRFADAFLELVNPDLGNVIIGSSTTSDAMRGDRYRRGIVDEANSIRGLPDLLESLEDVGPLWLVSSVKGRVTGFARLCHGELGAEVHDYGHHIGQRGWVISRWHYSMRPDRRPGTEAGDRWRAAKMAAMSPSSWAQEHEIDDMASVPGRIWAGDLEEQFHILDKDWWRSNVLPAIPSAELYEGWDFGYEVTLTSVVWAAIIDDALFILDYRHWESAVVETVVDEVAKAGYRTDRIPQGRLPNL